MNGLAPGKLDNGVHLRGSDLQSLACSRTSTLLIDCQFIVNVVRLHFKHIFGRTWFCFLCVSKLSTVLLFDIQNGSVRQGVCDKILGFDNSRIVSSV